MENIKNSKQNNSSINEIKNIDTFKINSNKLTSEGELFKFETLGVEGTLKSINKNLEKNEKRIETEMSKVKFNKRIELDTYSQNIADIQEPTTFIHPEQKTISNYSSGQELHEQIFSFNYASHFNSPVLPFTHMTYSTQPPMKLFQEQNINQQLYNLHQNSIPKNHYLQNSRAEYHNLFPSIYSQLSYTDTVEKTSLIQPKDALEYFDMNFDKITNKYSMTKESLQDDIQIRQFLIRVIQKVADTHKVNFDHALIGFCALMQAGGYLKSVTNRKITVGGIEFSKRTILYAMEEISCKYTLRSLSRYNRAIIAKVAKKYNYPGHLYARFKIENPNLIANLPSEEQEYYARYCTDFQIENPDTPPLVREFLANREKSRNYSSKKNHKK